MSKYIDVDKIIEHLNDEIEGCEDCDVCFRPVTYGTRLGLEYSKSLVETAETADVQEVRHGKWEKCKECCCEYRCSVCEYELCRTTNYCPNCGAKMDGERGIDTNKG